MELLINSVAQTAPHLLAGTSTDDIFEEDEAMRNGAGSLSIY